MHLRLTPAGMAASAEVPHVLAAVNNDLLKAFSEAEWKQLRKMLDRLSANAQAMAAEGVQA